MGKLAKRVAIARSGVYSYSAEALPGLGLSAPPEKKGNGTFSVYRPSTVLAKAKDKFTRLPVTLEHPRVMVNGNNFRELAQGFTGDTATVEYLKDINEVTINSTITLMDNEAVNAYYRGIVEVSPGYIGVFDWEEGVSPNNEKYDIVMRDITEVNHLAMTRAGRGGKTACILDSREVGMKRRNSGLFYAVAKFVSGVKDSGEGSFNERMSSLIADRLKLTPEEISKRVDSLREVVDYLPDSEDKPKLVRYVEDLERINEENDESANMIGLMIGNLFYTLDTAAMADSPPVADASENKESPEKGESKEEHEAEGPDHEKNETPQEEKAEHEGETGAPEVEAESTVPEKQLTAEDVSIGLDDSVFDKRESELTPEECEYIHRKLMEMLKENLKSKVVANMEGQMPGEVPPVAAAEEKVEETKESPIEEKKEEPKEEKKEEKKEVSDSAEPQYPTDVLTELTVSDSSAKGIDINAFFKDKLKGGK